MTYEGLRLKILEFKRKKFAGLRQKQLKNKNFTIISNNCWGGMTYEAYGISKQSPTVGLFFMAEDYIKFISDLRGFVEGNLKFIKPEESRWKSAPQVGGDKRFGSYPIAVLSNKNDEIEIFFLHSHSENEAREKWSRRCKRINWDKLLIKFNDQNGCTNEDIMKFIQLPYKNKLFFTAKKWEDEQKYRSVLGSNFWVVHQFTKDNNITASHEPFGASRYINITEILNHLS